MKNIKILFCVLVGTLVFTSCSQDEDVHFAEPSQGSSPHLASKIDKGDVDKFINNFYGKSFVYGDSIQTSDNLTSYMVKEIIVSTDTRARGYIAIDLSTKTPIGFIDVDRDNKMMKSIDLQTEEVDISGDLSEDPVFNDNGYDFIELIEEGNKYQTQGWFVWVGWIFTMDNFWGTTVTHGPCHTEEIGGTFQQVHTVTITKRRFWISWSSPTVIEGVPC